MYKIQSSKSTEGQAVKSQFLSLFCLPSEAFAQVFHVNLGWGPVPTTIHCLSVLIALNPSRFSGTKKCL